MIRDVQFGLLLLAVVAVALGQRILPQYADRTGEGKPASASSAVPPPTLALGDKPDPAKATLDKPASSLTTIFPDGYKEKLALKKKNPSPGSELSPPPPKLPGDELAQGPASAAPDAPAAPASSDGPVLPTDELPLPVDGEGEARTSGERVAKRSAKPAKPNDDDEIVTEFLPFTEPEEEPKASGKPTEGKKSSPKRAVPDRSSRQAMVAPNPFPKPESVPRATPPGKREPVLFPGAPKGTPKGGLRAGAGGTGPAAVPPPAPPPPDDKPAIVQSFDVKDAGEKEANHPDVHLAKRGKPVHPFFERYLDRKTYYTRAGDTLESIALSLYQDPAMAESLFKANAEQLKAPGELRPGMILRLP